MVKEKDFKSTIDLNEVRGRLIARKGELEGELADLASEKVVTDQAQDPGDQALSSSIEALRSSLQDNEFDEYTRIIRALEMLDDGTYGFCIECGGDISRKRLRSYPNAARCVICQEAHEEKSGF